MTHRAPAMLAAHYLVQSHAGSLLAADTPCAAQTDDATTSGEANPWSATMARMLLDATTAPSSAPEAAGTAPDAAASARHSQQQAARQHWATALPEHVPLAFAHASEAELRGIGDQELVNEALGVRQLLLDSFEVGRPGTGTAFLHGCRCVKSRAAPSGTMAGRRQHGQRLQRLRFVRGRPAATAWRPGAGPGPARTAAASRTAPAATSSCQALTWPTMPLRPAPASGQRLCALCSTPDREIRVMRALKSRLGCKRDLWHPAIPSLMAHGHMWALSLVGYVPTEQLCSAISMS